MASKAAAADGSPAFFLTHAAQIYAGAVKLGGKMVHNIAYNSPQMYLASGLAFGVAKLYISQQMNPLHAAMFVGTAVVAHSVVKPLIKLIVSQHHKETPKNWTRLITVTNALAITAGVAALLALKVTLIQGVALTTVTYLVANGVLNALKAPVAAPASTGTTTGKV
jgi:hypothetical protein